MEKLTGKNISVFISGRGTNLRSLIKEAKKENSIFNIKLVICNNKNAKGLIYAKKNKIPFLITEFKDRKKSEKLIIDKVTKNKIDLICLAGFMKILSSHFINKIKTPILNIHPSLLPKYKGLNTHFRAIKNKDKFSGTTVHAVNSKLDSGKIILQKKIKINKNDNAKTLEKKILKIEYKLYPRAIKKFLSSF